MLDFFIRNDRFAYLFIVILLGVGAYSVANIPRESAPEVVIPVGIITTALPGAPATDIESLVTNEIERGLTNLDNVSQITSTSREGVSSVTVEFEASADVDDSIDALKDEVDRIAPSLPDTAEEPTVSQVDFQDQPIVTIVVSGDRSDRGFIDVAAQVEDELEALAGVSNVSTSGVRDPEVQVLVERAALAQFDIALRDITNAISNHNRTFPVGEIVNDGIAYTVGFAGDIKNIDEIADIPITTRGEQPVYVGDVATVIDGLAPAGSISRHSVAGAPSQNAITFDVFKQTEGDVTRISSAVTERLEALQQPGEVLEGFAVDTILDSGELVLDDLVRLSSSGLQTVALVILLLVVAIGWREGLLAGLAIPLSFLFGFIGLYFSDNSINFLSLFSLILGVGILVDSAIVVVEGINRRMKADSTIDKQAAAIATVREFAAPLTSGTLTTISMFVGLFIVTGVIGQFIASIPYTIVFLLLASLFVALFIIPLLATHFLKRRSATKIERTQTAFAQHLEQWYRQKLDTLLGNKTRERVFQWGLRAALLIALLLPVSGVVQVIFFAQSDADFVIVEVQEPAGTTKELTDTVVRRVEEVLYQEAGVASFAATIGQGSQFGSGGSGENVASIFVSLADERERTSMEIVDSLRADFAGFADTDITVTQPSNGPPTGAAVVLRFTGEDLDRLSTVANESSLLLSELEGTTNVDASTNSNTTEFVLDFNRAEAARFGLDPLTVSQTARTAVFGTEATSLTTLTDDVPVVVQLNLTDEEGVNPERANQATIEAIEQLTIPSPTGEAVLLGSVVNVGLRESSSVINHQDQERVVTVTADITGDANARSVQAAAVERVRNEIDLTGVQLSTGGGETEESNEAFAQMGLALVIGVLLMICVLTLQFNSFRHTAYVLTILPYSLIGIFTGLAITGSALSFPSIMGFIALSGIVVNNSILLIDVMNQQRKQYPEKSIRDVVLDAASSRVRPILLTTLTTVIGMVPLALAGEIWAPLAFSIMFGLVFSVVITLILIPVIYHRNPGRVTR